jgi:hypothetical protein
MITVSSLHLPEDGIKYQCMPCTVGFRVPTYSNPCRCVGGDSKALCIYTSHIRIVAVATALDHHSNPCRKYWQCQTVSPISLADNTPSRASWAGPAQNPSQGSATHPHHLCPSSHRRSQCVPRHPEHAAWDDQELPVAPDRLRLTKTHRAVGHSHSPQALTTQINCHGPYQDHCDSSLHINQLLRHDHKKE